MAVQLIMCESIPNGSPQREGQLVAAMRPVYRLHLQGEQPLQGVRGERFGVRSLLRRTALQPPTNAGLGRACAVA